MMTDCIFTYLRPLLVLLTLGVSEAFCQVDFDKDGLLELVVTRIESDKRLRWFAQELQSDEVNDLGLFGQDGVQTSLGYWKEYGLPTRAVVGKGKNTQLDLSVEGQGTDVTIGAFKEKAFVILGRDINGSGTADALLMDRLRRVWAWKFTFDPFSQSGPNFKRSLFGERSAVPFLFKGRSRYEYLAILRSRGGRSATVQYRNLNNKKLIRTVRLGDVAVGKVAPLLLRNAAGRDDFVFIDASEESTLALTVNLRGKVVARNNYPKDVVVVTGYFSSTVEEELGYIASQNLVLNGKFDKKIPLLGEVTTIGPKAFSID
jgi:hypothetical protein